MTFKRRFDGLEDLAIDPNDLFLAAFPVFAIDLIAFFVGEDRPESVTAPNNRVFRPPQHDGKLRKAVFLAIFDEEIIFFLREGRDLNLCGEQAFQLVPP